MPRPVPAVLSIAGSDSGGGAGIQADLKAFARCGVHGMTAITALTAQSTVGVTGIHPVPGEFIIEQVRTVADDIGVDAVKIGMLGTAETVRAVREALGHIEDGVPIVIDPVMVAESGAVLLDDEARAAIVTRAAAAGDRDHAEPARGARAGRRGARAQPDATTSRISRGRCTRSGRQRRRHRRPSRRGHGRLLRRDDDHAARRASGIPTARRTGPGARTRARSRRISRSGSARWRRRGRRGGSRRRRCATGTASIGRGPGPVNVLGAASVATRHDARSGWRGARDIMPGMKFLRMRPGYGEQLIAEGDIEVGEDEQMLVEEFRRQLEQGMWAAIPVQTESGRREAEMVRGVRGDPA